MRKNKSTAKPQSVCWSEVSFTLSDEFTRAARERGLEALPESLVKATRRIWRNEVPDEVRDPSPWRKTVFTFRNTQQYWADLEKSYMDTLGHFFLAGKADRTSPNEFMLRFRAPGKYAGPKIEQFRKALSRPALKNVVLKVL